MKCWDIHAQQILKDGIFGLGRNKVVKATEDINQLANEPIHEISNNVAF